MKPPSEAREESEGGSCRYLPEVELRANTEAGCRAVVPGICSLCCKGSILSHQNVCRRAARGKNQLGINSNAVHQANNPPCMVDSAARGLPFSCSIIQPKLNFKYILFQIQKGLPGIVPPFIGRQQKTQQSIFHLAGAASAGHLRPASKLL